MRFRGLDGVLHEGERGVVQRGFGHLEGPLREHQLLETLRACGLAVDQLVNYVHVLEALQNQLVEHHYRLLLHPVLRGALELVVKRLQLPLEGLPKKKHLGLYLARSHALQTEQCGQVVVKAEVHQKLNDLEDDLAVDQQLPDVDLVLGQLRDLGQRLHYGTANVLVAGLLNRFDDCEDGRHLLPFYAHR